MSDTAERKEQSDGERIKDLELTIKVLHSLQQSETKVPQSVQQSESFYDKWLRLVKQGLGERWNDEMLFDKRIIKSLYINSKYLKGSRQLRITTYIDF